MPGRRLSATPKSWRGSPSSVPALRSVLRRELSGDLDNIVMMAMRKEAERRYGSVERFSADIDLYLRGMPVLARQDTWTYRAHKFVARHTLGVALSGLVRAAARRDSR